MIPKMTSAIEKKKALQIIYKRTPITVLPIAIGIKDREQYLKAAEFKGDNKVNGESLINNYNLTFISEVQQTEEKFTFIQTNRFIEKGLDFVVFPFIEE